MENTPKASSTDKLLELIRGGAKKAVGGGTPSPQPLAPKKAWMDRLKAMSSGGKQPSRNVRLGVELTADSVRMVKLTKGTGRSRTLEYRTVSIPEQGPDAPELSLVVRLALKDFLGKAEADIWAMVPAESADLRFLQVPKTGKKQLSNAIYWTAKKEESFDDNEVIFDYEVQGEVMEKGAPRLSVLAYTVKREEFEKLRNLFLQAGYPLTGVTVPSVAMRNLLRAGWLENGGQTRACLHLGAEFSRLEIFGGGNLQFVRILKGGLAAMAQTLADASKEFTPPPPPVPEPAAAAQTQSVPEDARDEESILVVPEEPVFSTAMPIVIEDMTAPPPPPEKSTVGLTPEEALSLLTGLASGPGALPEGHPGRLLSPADILEMLKPAWERLLRQVQMTFSHHTVTLGNEQVGSLNLSGPLGTDPGLLEYLSGKLGVPCSLLDPLDPENLGRIMVAGPALSLGERQPYTLVVGLTESDRAACNLLYTYRQKEEEDRVESLNRMVALVWLGVALLCGGYFAWQQTEAYMKQQTLGGLNKKLSQFQPLVDMPLLLGTTARVRSTLDNLRRYAGRSLPAAVLRDVTELTPENVKLYAISLDLGTPEEQPMLVPDAPAKPGAKPPAAVKHPRESLDTLMLEGYVKGDSPILESLLSAYMVRLRTSPLLGEPSVIKRSVETTPAGEDVLRFTMICQVRR